jgi:hypothetical protein
LDHQHVQVGLGCCERPSALQPGPRKDPSQFNQ